MKKFTQPIKNVKSVIIINTVFLFLGISCKNNTSILKSELDKEGRYILVYYLDSIYLDYVKYNDKIDHSEPLFRKGDEFWEPELKEIDKNGLINLGAPLPENVFLAKKEYRFQILNNDALSDGSILIYSENGKYLTKIISNNRPFEKTYYYDENFHIDSIVKIIRNDTLIYR